MSKFSWLPLWSLGRNFGLYFDHILFLIEFVILCFDNELSITFYLTISSIVFIFLCFTTTHLIFDWIHYSLFRQWTFNSILMIQSYEFNLRYFLSTAYYWIYSDHAIYTIEPRMVYFGNELSILFQCGNSFSNKIRIICFDNELWTLF